MLGGQGSTNLLTPEQMQFLSSSLGGGGAYSQFLQPQSQEDLQSAFQKGVVDPQMQIYNQQTVPGLQQRFVDAGAGSSSAMNQALASSAQDLQTSLGAQYLPFMQGQQQNTLSALGQLGGMAGARTFEPYQQQGALPGLAQGAGQGAVGLLGKSSRTIKENIRPYREGLEMLQELEVKKYDFIERHGGIKDNVGLIAETLPETFTGMIDGVLGVDVYGLVGLLINSVKELSSKVEQLEAK